MSSSSHIQSHNRIDREILLATSQEDLLSAAVYNGFHDVEKWNDLRSERRKSIVTAINPAWKQIPGDKRQDSEERRDAMDSFESTQFCNGINGRMTLRQQKSITNNIRRTSSLSVDEKCFCGQEKSPCLRSQYKVTVALTAAATPSRRKNKLNRLRTSSIDYV